MDKKSLLCIYCLLSFAAASFSCGGRPLEKAKNFKSNRAPVITGFTSNYSGQLIIPGLTIRAVAEAYDPDGNEFIFSFSSDKGSFSNIIRRDNICTVDYIIGDISGGEEIILDVTVSDKKGASSTGSLNIGKSNTGPVLKQLNETNSVIRAADVVPVKFISDSAGYYQILVIDDDSLSCNYDDNKPWYTLIEETEISINIYGPAYEEGFTPQLNP